MKNKIYTKKTLLLLLVMSMFLAFVGCSKGGETPTTASTEPSSEVVTEPSGVTDQADVFVKPENYATVMLVTINPQFRLYLDADGIVLAVESVNKDAEEIQESISFENDSYETVVEKIVTKSEEKGYIKSDAVISVEIIETRDPAVNTVDILDKITITVNQTASKLELTVEIKTEDKTTVEKQPDANVTEPPEKPTTAPTTSSADTTPTTPMYCSHTYKDATCTAPKTCSACGATDGGAKGHNWQKANCTTPKTCKTCSMTEGAVAQHIFEKYVCTICNSSDEEGIAIATNPKLSFKEKIYFTNHYSDEITIQSELISFHPSDSSIAWGYWNCKTAEFFNDIEDFRPLDTLPQDSSFLGNNYDRYYTVYNGKKYYCHTGSSSPIENLTYELTDSEIIVSSPAGIVLKFKMNIDGTLIVTYSTLTERKPHTPLFNVGDVCW